MYILVNEVVLIKVLYIFINNRNVLKVIIDVLGSGEVEFYCIYLDYLDENWRMK